MNYKLLSDKNLVVSSNIVKYLDKSISLNEFLVLLYFINNESTSFDAEAISNLFNISINEVIDSFNNLITKKIIDLDTKKDKNNKVVEKISLDNLYEKVLSSLEKEQKEEKKDSIFDTIEKEFDKKLSPIDMEIINGWLEIGTPEELIVGALKEASYNGVKTLRYMDQIIYEWNKKGFKTMEDVNNHLKNKREERIKGNDSILKKEQELLDYDWLND